MRFLRDHWPDVIFYALLAALGFCTWYGASAVEASVYERITGVEVSAWDAMFVQLRIDGAPR